MAGLALCAAVLALPGIVGAQETPPPSGSVAAADSSRLRTARELLEVMQMMRVIRAGNVAMVESQTAANPAMAPFKDVLLAWAEKHLTWDVMAPPMSAAYAELLTEPEMRELIAFYRTPAGRKVVEVTPELTQRGAKIGADIAQRYMPQLQEMIQARANELTRSAPAKP